MSQSPDIKVRLTPQGVTDVIQALRTVQREADRAGAKAHGGLGGVSKALGDIRAALPAIGFAAAITGFTLLAKSAADFADEMGKGAQKVGTSSENLSVLSAAAATADVEQEKLTISLGRLAKNLGELKRGTDEQVESFDELGLSAKDFAGKDTVQAFDLIAGKLAKMTDGTEKTELAIRIFGRSGAQLIPLLNDLGNKGFAAVRAEAEKLGIVVSTDLALAAEAMNDSFTLMGQQAKGLALQFVAGLAPAIVDTFSTLQDESSGEGAEAFKEFGVAVGQVFGIVVYTLRLFGRLVSTIVGTSVRQIGGMVAALHAFARGDFKQAGVIINEVFTEVKEGGVKAITDFVEDGGKLINQFGKDLKPIPLKVKPTADLDAADAAVQDLGARFKKLVSKGPITDIKDAIEAEKKRFEITSNIRESEAQLMQDLLKIRLGGNANLIAAEQRLSFAEQFQLALRTRARMESYGVELELIKARDAALVAAIKKQHGDTKTGKQLLLEVEKQSGKDRFALETKYVDDLIKLRDVYVNKYKQSLNAIKALDAEVASGRKDDEATIRSAKLELLTEEQKFIQLTAESRAKLTALKAAVGTGDLERARELRKELQAVAGELLRAKPEGVDRKDVISLGDAILAESRKLLELAIAEKRVAEVTNAQAAATGVDFISTQIDKAKAKLDVFLSEAAKAELKVPVSVNDASMTAMIQAITESLNAQKFFVQVQPVVAQAQGGQVPALARGGRIRGSSPSPTADNILIAATAGEFMQPVKAVRHYGTDFMESIRNMELPRFGEGGSIGGGTSATDRVELAITIDSNNVGSVFGPRDTVGALADALRQIDRG